MKRNIYHEMNLQLSEINTSQKDSLRFYIFPKILIFFLEIIFHNSLSSKFRVPTIYLTIYVNAQAMLFQAQAILRICRAFPHVRKIKMASCFDIKGSFVRGAFAEIKTPSIKFSSS